MIRTSGLLHNPFAQDSRTQITPYSIVTLLMTSASHLLEIPSYCFCEIIISSLSAMGAGLLELLLSWFSPTTFRVPSISKW